ncbi:MAG: tyrosine-type recombinase/integrase [Ruminococcus sp.]|nr:tyrosine-type recombinase/integrase [Ruminococcus sp.]
MKCKKCRKEIPDKSKFCNWCGKPINDKKPYRRPDGLYEKSVTINGKRKVFRGKTERELNLKIAEFNNEVELGPLFKDMAEQWESEHFPTLSPTTQRGYSPAYNEVKEYFGDEYIKKITHKDINKYLKQLPSTYARKTVSTRLLVLNLIFKFAINEDVISESPCSYVSVPKGHGATKRRAPTEEEIERIKLGVNFTWQGFKVGLFAVFVLYTGLRKGEALALQYKDIDYNAARIDINKTVYYDVSVPMIKNSPKTNAGRRTIIIPQYLLKLLPKGNKNHYLFSEHPEKPCSKSTYEVGFRHWQKETNIKLTAHCLRHGYSTMLHEAGVDVKDAQALLGHADITTTQNIYTDVSNKQKEKAENLINKYLQ